MNDSSPAAAGWYPDNETGGTRYWDGSRWSGDTRPQRRSFAAASAHRGWGVGLVVFGVLAVLTSPTRFGQTAAEGASTMSPLGAFFFSIFAGLAFAAVGVYLFRGQGPSTKSVEARIASEREKARLAAALKRMPPPPAPSVVVNVATPAGGDAARAAQINAIANPETAKALQNLQNLLYTQAITEVEFQTAKDRLLGTV